MYELVNVFFHFKYNTCKQHTFYFKLVYFVYNINVMMQNNNVLPFYKHDIYRIENLVGIRIVLNNLRLLFPFSSFFFQYSAGPCGHHRTS